MPILAKTSSRLAVALLVLTLALPGLGAEPASTVVLVAKPELQDALYSATILIVRALPDGRHVGFILNKPTELTLATAFPEQAASKTAVDPLYLGGPVAANAVFALVQTHDSPGSGSMQIAPDLFLATTKDTVNRIVEQNVGHARFFLGTVVWQPGELAAENARGVWYVLDVQPELVLPSKTEGLWERLVQRAELYAKAI